MTVSGNSSGLQAMLHVEIVGSDGTEYKMPNCTEKEFKTIGVHAFFDTNDDADVDWEDWFGLKAISSNKSTKIKPPLDLEPCTLRLGPFFHHSILSYLFSSISSIRWFASGCLVEGPSVRITR